MESIFDLPTNVRFSHKKKVIDKPYSIFVNLNYPIIGYPLWIALLVYTLYAKILKPSSFPIPTFLFSFFKNSSLHIQSLSMFFNETSKVTETKTIVLSVPVEAV